MVLKGIIYKTTNLINGKIYIGQKFVDKVSYLGSGVRLHKAIKKYGKENFQKITLEECDRKLLNDREQYWIAFYDSMNPEIGYNLTSGGHQNSEFSNSTKKLMSDNRIGVTKSDEHKKRIGLSNLGKINSVEHKEKISKANKGKIPWNKGKTGVQIPWNKGKTGLQISHNKGKHLSDETKQKMSNSKIGIGLGRKLSDETKQKMSKSRTGSKLSDETKQKISKFRTGISMSQETKDKISKTRHKLKTITEDEKV